MSVTTLSTRGQVVIPAEVRATVGLTAGDKITVTVSNDGLEIRLRKQETLDEMAERLSQYVKPGTPPLLDVHGFYEQRAPRV